MPQKLRLSLWAFGPRIVIKAATCFQPDFDPALTELCNQFVQAFDDLAEFCRVHFPCTLADSFHGDCSYLRDLYPRCERKAASRQSQCEGKACPGWLTRNRHRDYSARTPIEMIIAEDQHRTDSRLLAPAHRVHVGPVNLSPQYVGHDSSPRPSSARLISSAGSSLFSSRTKRCRLSRSTK